MKSLLQISGGLGLFGVLLGLAILIASCSGFDAAVFFSPAVILLGFTDLILTIIASRSPGSETDGPVLASLFLALLCIAGGLLELAVWIHLPILFNQPL